MPIEHTKSSTVITGNAINWYAALVVQKAIMLYLKTGLRLSRNASPSYMREMVTKYTGTTYPRSRKGLEQALVDITATVTKNPDSVTPNGAQ